MQPMNAETASTQSEPSPICMVGMMMVHLGSSKNVVHGVQSLAHPAQRAMIFLETPHFHCILRIKTGNGFG